MDCQTDGVFPNLLCGNCDRIVNKSKIIQHLIVTASDNSFSLKLMPGPTETKPIEKEIFFHSPRLETIMSSIASGCCHLCSIVSWDGKKYFQYKDQSITASALEHSSGIVQVSVTEAWTSGQTFMSFDILTDMQTSASQMEDAAQMDSVLNDRLRGLQGWERWRGGRSLGVISLRKANGLIFPPSTSGSGTRLPISTDSPESVATLKYWLNECRRNHSECQSFFHPFGLGEPPTRLIDVGEAEGPLRPRLVETRDFTTWETISYLTLSHCWGDLNMDIMLTKTSYATFLEHGIPVESLRRTIRDAMNITRRLGCRYIWIDSLCIIQDSPEDWAAEALTMKEVYGSSSCNIAALGQPGDGCFVKRNPLHFFPCYIGGKHPNSKDRVYAFRHYNPSLDSREDVDGGPPLLRRGWVVQEKLLSTRVIYMGIPQLYWECARYNTLSEGVPVMEKSVSTVPFYSRLVCSKSDFRALYDRTKDLDPDWLQHEAQNMIHLSKCWMRMVSDYCKMKFTKKEDRFVAFAGVAQTIAVRRRWTYVAGTWKESWPFDLLWARNEPDPKPMDLRWREDRFKHIIPSWSWAYNSTSIDSMSEANPAVHFLPSRYQQLFDPVTLRLTITSLATVIDFSCPDFMTQHSSEAKYGDIKLSLRGEVLRGRVSTLIGTSGVQVHWDIKNPPQNELLFLLLMRWTEFGDEQQAGLVLMKQMAPVSRVSQHMYFRVGVWEDYSPQPRRGRRLLFTGSVAEEVVHLC